LVIVIIAGAAGGAASSGVDSVPGRERELAPHDLACACAPCSPALRDLADNLKAAAALVIIGRLAQPGQGRGVIKYLAEKRAFQDESQADFALRVPNGIGN
jgi:hypothetical protein